MKTVSKLSLLLIILSVAACSPTPQETIYKPTFYLTEYKDDIVLHTELQKSYLDGDYLDIATYAQGVSELSRPQPLVINFDFNVDPVINDLTYQLKLSENPDLSNAKTYESTSKSFEITNLFLDTKYYYSITAFNSSYSFTSEVSSFKTEGNTIRNLYVSGVTNVRDLGGFTLDDGKQVKQGLIYRTGQLNERYASTPTPNVTLKGRKTLLDEFNIKTEIDLRELKNTEVGNLDESILGKNVNYYSKPMTWDCTKASYQEKDIFISIFKLFASEANYPIVFHCAIGTDRTGAIAFYLGALLGKNVKQLYQDYLFSNFGNIGSSRDTSSADAHLEYLNTFDGDTLQEKTENYFLENGLTQEEINSIKDILLIES